LNLSLETNEIEKFSSIFEYNYNKYYNLFNIKNRNSIYDITTYLISWNLSKLSEINIEFLTKDKLHFIIQDLIILLENFEKYIVLACKKDEFYYINTKILIINVLINALKFYGDKKTEKGNTIFSPYNKLIINVLLKNSNIIYYALLENNNKDNYYLEKKFNLVSLYFKLFKKLIEYSSDDFQDIIEEVLFNIAELYTKINCKIKEIRDFEQEYLLNNQNDDFPIIKSEIIIDYKNHIISIINVLLGKINRIAKEDIIKEILNNLIFSFELETKISYNTIDCIGLIIPSNSFYVIL